MEHQSLMLGDRWAGCSQWCHSAGGHPWEAECFVQRKRSSSSGPFGAPDSRPAGGDPSHYPSVCPQTLTKQARTSAAMSM